MARSRRPVGASAARKATQPCPQPQKPRLAPVAAQERASKLETLRRVSEVHLGGGVLAKLCDRLLDLDVPVSMRMLVNINTWCAETDPDESKGHAAAMLAIVRLGVGTAGWSLFEYAKSVDAEAWHRVQRHS